MASVGRILFISVIFVIVLCTIGSCRKNTDTGEDDPRVVSLLRGYNKHVAPSEPMTLTYGISPVKVVGVDSERGVLTVDLWLRNQWIDPRLNWLVEDHDASPVFFRQNQLYVPEMELFNGRSKFIIGDSDVVSYPNGVTSYFPTIRAEIYCQLPEPPFKDTICPITIGPWSHDRRQTILGTFDPIVDDTFVLNTGSCTIGTSTAVVESSSYDCCPGLSFDTMVLNLNVSCSHSRIAPSSQALVMKPGESDPDKTNNQQRSTPCFLPLIITPFFVLLVFLLPPKATDRIFLGTIVFVALLLVWTSNYIPTDIEGFIQLSAGLILASTLASLVSCKLSEDHHKHLTSSIDEEPKAFGCKSRLGAMIDSMLFAAVAIVLGVAAAGTFA